MCEECSSRGTAGATGQPEAVYALAECEDCGGPTGENTVLCAECSARAIPLCAPAPAQIVHSAIIRNSSVFGGRPDIGFDILFSDVLLSVSQLVNLWMALRSIYHPDMGGDPAAYNALEAAFVRARVRLRPTIRDDDGISMRASSSSSSGSSSDRTTHGLWWPAVTLGLAFSARGNSH